MAWCEIALAPGERSMLHCSEHAVPSGCCRMECHGEQRCSTRALTVSDYMQASVGSSADGECGGRLGCGNCVIAETCFSKVKCRSRVTPSTFISLASGRSTSATVTDATVDVTAHSWCVIPTISASDLSGLSCRPFCMYHCLTSAVHAARTDSGH